ncbi:MAG: YdeI/OmpD-associated family protein [Anaerolineae bacterium]|nr:YdeI/OmpD-associated family protein [Anaerolineae bacterium]
MPNQRFKTTIQSGDRGRVFINLPFDPAAIWGKQKRHHVKGTINNFPFASSLGVNDGQYFMPLAKEFRDQAGLFTGDVVTVDMELDTAQTEPVPDDLASALEYEPEARTFFDGLEPIYRNTYIAWITEARQPDTRADRIRQTVAYLRAGRKQR